MAKISNLDHNLSNITFLLKKLIFKSFLEGGLGFYRDVFLQYFRKKYIPRSDLQIHDFSRFVEGLTKILQKSFYGIYSTTKHQNSLSLQIWNARSSLILLPKASLRRIRHLSGSPNLLHPPTTSPPTFLLRGQTDFIYTSFLHFLLSSTFCHSIRRPCFFFFKSVIQEDFMSKP